MIPLTPDNKDIWLYHFAFNFPFSSIEINDRSFDDFLCMSYELPSNDWIDEFTGGTDDNGREKEPWTGKSLDIKINDNVTFSVEFHAFETVYFLNDVYIGNTGGHFKLSLLSWKELINIVRNSDILFFMMLPLAMGNKAEQAEICKEIEQRLTNPLFPFQAKDHNILAQYLTDHLILEDDVTYTEHPQAGIVCDRNHSCRNLTNNTIDEVKEVNELISLSMK